MGYSNYRDINAFQAAMEAKVNGIVALRFGCASSSDWGRIPKAAVEQALTNLIDFGPT